MEATTGRPPYGSRPGGPSPGAPLRLGHLVPERLPVVVTRPNPEWAALDPSDPKRAELPEMVDVILQGYVFGDRCPGVVKAELAAVEETYRRAVMASTEDPEAVSTSIYVAAWHTFLRESILALVPGMTPGEADVLASALPGATEGPAPDLLRYLGLWQPADESEPIEGEVVGGAEPPSITAPSSPISSPSMESDPASS